jgi:hypothetical protein
MLTLGEFVRADGARLARKLPEKASTVNVGFVGGTATRSYVLMAYDPRSAEAKGQPHSDYKSQKGPRKGAKPQRKTSSEDIRESFP